MAVSSDSNPQHTLFCRLVGIPVDYGYPIDLSNEKTFADGKNKHFKGLHPRVLKAYRWHTFQYWLVATLSNTFLMLQIVLGATLTALGGTKSDKVSLSIVLLGAIQTILGGFLTYFKSRNQPNRARQYRSALRKVLDAIENAEEILRDPDYKPPPYVPLALPTGNTSMHAGESWMGGAPGTTVTGVEGMVLRLMDMYTDAVREAEANYPDFWLTNKRTGEQGDSVGVKDMLAQMAKSGGTQQTTNTSTSGPISAVSGSTASGPTVSGGMNATTSTVPGATSNVGNTTTGPTGANAV